MKSAIATLVFGVTMTLGAAAPSWGLDFPGRWGLGAGLLSGTGEISLIRVSSSRFLWATDVQFRQEETTMHDDPVVDRGDQSFLFLAAGPRVRRFTGGDAIFSPYWDVSLHARFTRVHSLTQNLETLGGDLGGALGAEYLTPWHASVAVHAEVVAVSWSRVRETLRLGNAVQHATGHEQTATLTFRPALYVRAYF